MASSLGARLGALFSNTKKVTAESADGLGKDLITTKGFFWKKKTVHDQDGALISRGTIRPSINKYGIGQKEKMSNEPDGVGTFVSTENSRHYSLFGRTDKTKKAQTDHEGTSIETERAFSRYGSSSTPELTKTGKLLDVDGQKIAKEVTGSDGAKKVTIYDADGKNPRVAPDAQDMFDKTPYESLSEAPAKGTNWTKAALWGAGGTLATGAVAGGTYGIVAATRNSSGASGSTDPGAEPPVDGATQDPSYPTTATTNTTMPLETPSYSGGATQPGYTGV